MDQWESTKFVLLHLPFPIRENVLQYLSEFFFENIKFKRFSRETLKFELLRALTFLGFCEIRIRLTHLIRLPEIILTEHSEDINGCDDPSR